MNIKNTLPVLFVSVIMPLAAAPQTAAQTPPPAGSPMPCGAAMGDMSKMMAKMDQTDAALEQKVAQMNAAKGTKKVDLMANIIDQMVNERRQMHAAMLNMMNARGPMMAGTGAPMMRRGMAGAGMQNCNCPCMQSNTAGRTAPAAPQQ